MLTYNSYGYYSNAYYNYLTYNLFVTERVEERVIDKLQKTILDISDKMI